MILIKLFVIWLPSSEVSSSCDINKSYYLWPLCQVQQIDLKVRVMLMLFLDALSTFRKWYTDIRGLWISDYCDVTSASLSSWPQHARHLSEVFFRNTLQIDLIIIHVVITHHRVIKHFWFLLHYKPSTLHFDKIIEWAEHWRFMLSLLHVHSVFHFHVNPLFKRLIY